MAQYNEMLVGRFNRFFQKLTGIKGRAPVVQLAGELQPTHPLFHGAENRWLESWQRYVISTTSGPQAGVNSAVRFRNPAASNIVAVFEALSFGFVPGGATADLNLSLQITNADLTTVLSGGFRMDARQGGSGVFSTIVPSRQNNDSTGNVFLAVHTVQQGQLVQAIITHDQEITVLPGDAVEIYGSSVNTQIYVNAVWRERFLEEPERQ